MPLIDERTSKQIVGQVQNAYGMHTADVIADNDVAAWIATALRAELEAVGYAVTEPAEGQAADAPMLECRIATVSGTAYVTFKGRVSFFANINKDGREVLNKVYYKQVSSGTSWFASGAGYAEALSLALAAAARELAADVRNAGI